MRIQKSNIVTIIISFSAIFVCLKMTIGGQIITQILAIKVMCRGVLLFFILYHFINGFFVNNRFIVNKPVALFTFLNLFIFLSLGYSVDKSNSFISFAEYLTSSLAGYYLGRNYSGRCDILFKSVLFMAATVLGILFYYFLSSPSDVFVSMDGSLDSSNFVGLGGSIIHVHSLAMLFLILFVCSLWSDIKYLSKLILSVFCIAIIVATLSRTGLIILTVVIAFWFLSYKKPTKINLIIVIFFIVSVFFAVNVYSEKILSLFIRGAPISDLLSGSNRIYIFSSGLDEFIKSPFLGFGFDNFSFLGNSLIVDNSYSRNSLHNQFLYFLVSTGIVGFCLFTLFLVSLINASIKKQQKHNIRNAGFFIVLLIFSLTQDTISNDSTPLQFCTFIILGSTATKIFKKNG